MTKRLATAMVVAFLVLAGGVSLSLAQQERANEPPLPLQIKDVQFRIVEATFVNKLETADARFEETELDLYRGLVLTVQVKKAAGSELTLVAQDFPLHYRYGAKSDVARCEGLSTFSKQEDVDRTMSLYPGGLGRSSTGLSTTKAGTIYVDMFFQFMEPDTSELYLFVAQPVGATFETTGWE